MPLRPAYGLPGTKAVPDDWAARHAPVAASTHTARITLHRPPVAPDFDWDTARATPAEAAGYAADVAAEISAEQSRADTDLTTGEERIETADYRVAAANDLDCHENDLVEVLACPDDPLLAGRWLRVDQVLLGAGRFERDLMCVLLPLTTS